MGSQLYLKYRDEERSPLYTGHYISTQFFSPHFRYKDTQINLITDNKLQIQIDTKGMQGGLIKATKTHKHYRYTFKQDEVLPPEDSQNAYTDFAPYFMASSFKDHVELGQAYQAGLKNKTNVTPELQALADKGVNFTEVTLHVGAGTFLPVKVDDVTTHKMHAEWGEVTPEAAAEITATKQAGGRIIPVGTTALRLIETAARTTGQVQAWRGPTDIFIYPGFRFAVTDALMTNFHLPKSTLLMLVSALMGVERMRHVYAHAVSNGYRFFSYGDSSLLIP